MVRLKLTLILAAVFVLSAMNTFTTHADTKNGIYETKKEEIYEIENRKIKKIEKITEYYINNQPYTGYVEFGDGIHYFKDGKPIFYLTTNDGYEIFNRDGKKLDKTDEDFNKINDIINLKSNITFFKDIRYAVIGSKILKDKNINSNILKCKEGYILTLTNKRENLNLKNYKLKIKNQKFGQIQEVLLI